MSLRDTGAPADEAGPAGGAAGAAGGAGAIAPIPGFEGILADHEVEIYRYLRRLSPTPEDAADLHQETFLRAWRAHRRLQPGANVRAWLYRIASNAATDAHRRRAARPVARPLEDADRSRQGADRRFDPQAAVERAGIQAAVLAGLLELTHRQRTAVVGRIFDEMDYGSLGLVLGCTEPTARQHVSQGLRRLRALLASLLEETA